MYESGYVIINDVDKEDNEDKEDYDIVETSQKLHKKQIVAIYNKMSKIIIYLKCIQENKEIILNIIKIGLGNSIILDKKLTIYILCYLIKYYTNSSVDEYKKNIKSGDSLKIYKIIEVLSTLKKSVEFYKITKILNEIRYIKYI